MAGFVLVVGNGNWPSNLLMDTLFEQATQIVALDGAADRFEQWDVVVGDMDSIKNPKKYQADDGQCDSDLAKALREYEVNAIVGVEGGRLDHQLATFTSLFETESNAIIYFDTWRACRIPSEGLEMKLKIGTRCGIIPFGIVKEVRIDGCEFTLQDQDISTGTLGVGNRTISENVKLSHEGGDLLFIWEANVS
ncbi:MAG: hypothetical protein QGI21_02430 [Candidatus Poseidoniaceae archaeon]|jgi:thiamine pyrophosphokinase|nr:hypothetical protein [Candidatus Poseidoniaceae archaeon]